MFNGQDGWPSVYVQCVQVQLFGPNAADARQQHHQPLSLTVFEVGLVYPGLKTHVIANVSNREDFKTIGSFRNL